MAVHAGPAEHRAGNWFGPTLNRAARLLATAAGGQILCSHAAVSLTQDDLPPRVAIVDLGEHRLADLARPERVHQVTHPDLPSGFPPLQSLDAGRHNLPVALSSFVGRERELAEVISLLGTARLLTLTGIGGAGKTRLALQAAAAALGRFPDGAWLVELASVRDPELVATEVVTSLGFLPRALAQPGESLEDRLCDHLRHSRMLLVLDNCEHVVAAAAGVAHSVLSRCPDVTVLATSREVLGLPGEVIWNVPPLSMPAEELTTVEELARSDAVALFCDRAGAAHPGFGLSEANAAAVAKICRRLDGIPLGLELAAAKIRVLGAHHVAERLDDRFQLLTGGCRTAVPRHQTLRAAMDWSYDLLPVPEQSVLRRLTVFDGDLTLEAVEGAVGAVASEPGTGAGFEVLDVLSRLVDKSLVSVSREEPEVRYRLLETVREYAGQRLVEAGEAEEARRRHRDFFLALADAWAARTRYHDWGPWIQRVIDDQENFSAALEWSWSQGDHDELLRLAAAHWPYWYWSESLAGEHWLRTALDACPTPGPARVEALIGLATLVRDSAEDPRPPEMLFEEAMELANRLGSDELIAHVNFYWADLVLALGDHASAETMLRESIRRWDKAQFPTGVGWAHWGFGWIALSQDDVNGAASHFETTLQFAREVDDGTMRAHVLPALALVAALRGDHSAARTTATAGITGAERIAGAPRVLMMALARASEAGVFSGDDWAVPLVTRLLRLLRDKGVRYWVDETLDVVALVLADRRPTDAAIVLAASQAVREAFNQTGSQLRAVRERLQECRARLINRLGPERWEEAQRQARAMTPEDAVVYALTALENIDVRLAQNDRLSSPGAVGKEQ